MKIAVCFFCLLSFSFYFCSVVSIVLSLSTVAYIAM